MKILSWNTRGLGNPRGIRTLRELIKKEDPNVLFIQETRLIAHAMEKCKLRLGFVNCLSVSCVGYSEGLALFWKQEINLYRASQSLTLMVNW